MADSKEQALPTKSGVFDIRKIAAAFPESAATMLIDTRLTDEPEAKAKVANSAIANGTDR